MGLSRRLPLCLIAGALLWSAVARAAPPVAGSVRSAAVIEVDAPASGTNRLDQLTVTGMASYTTQAYVKSLTAYFKLVPAVGTPDGTTLINATDGRQWQIISSGGGGGGGLTQLTGPVTAGPGTGVQATSVTGNAITNAMLAQMATLTMKGNNTGGTANALDLTVSQVNTMLGVGVLTNPLSQFAATTSAQLLGNITDETGTGVLVFATSPTLVTPTLGVASATTINKVTLTAPATGSTLTIDNGFTLHVSANATLSGTNTGDQTITLTGPVTGSGTGSFATTLANIPDTTPALGSILHTAVAAPSTPAAGKASVYVDNTSKALANKNDAGTVTHTVATNTGTSHQWVSAIADTGAVTTTQPAFTDISGTVPLTQMATGTAGKVLVYDASGNPSSVGPGTTGQALLSNGAGAAPAFATLSGGGNALTTNPLSQFAATTSSQFFGVISDETGSGLVLGATSPTFASYNLHTAIAAPSSPSAGFGACYIDSTSLNWVCKTSGGVLNHGVQTNTGTSHQFVTAISDAGALTLAQPGVSDLSSSTSAQLAAVLSDETGTGANVFATSPTITTSTLAGATLSGALAAGANNITNVKNLTFTFNDNGNKTGAAPALADFTAAQDEKITLTGNVTGTPTWTFPTVSSTIFYARLQVCQDATGSRTIASWPSSPTLVWIGGSAPTLSTTASACDYLSFRYDGTTITGYMAGTGSGGGITALTGDGTASGTGSVAFINVNAPDGFTHAGKVVTTAITAPGTPAAGKANVYVDSTSKNIASKDDAGNVNHGVRTQAGTTHQWVSAIADNGTTTTSQPGISDLSSSTSASLAAVLSDETGTGANVFATSPTLVTPTLGVASATSMAMGNGNVTAVGQLTYNSEVNNGNKTGASQAIADFTAGHYQKITLTGAVSSSSWTLPSGVSSVQLKVCQDATGSRTLVWPSTNPPTWIGGTAPTLSTGASVCDLVNFYYDGTTMFGSIKAAPGGGSGVTAGTGDVTFSGTGSVTTTNVNAPTGFTHAGTVINTEIAAPSTPAAGKVTTWVDSTDARLHDKNPAGTIGTTVVADVGAANNYISAISAAGVITKSQPAVSNLASSTSASLATVLSDETGTGVAVFGTSPTITTPSIAAATMTGTLTLGDHEVNTTLHDDGNKTGAAPALLSWAGTGANHKITLTGNVTGVPTWTMPAGAAHLQLDVYQDATGGRTMTWPTSPTLTWIGGSAPTLTTTASGHDIINFWYDGTSIIGSAASYGTPITGLTGDVTATGPGSAPATIAANAVTNAKLATAGANTVKMNNTGSTATPTDVAVGTAFDALTTRQIDIASASTTPIATSAGVDVNITGTTTITSFSTCTAGVYRTVHFKGILTLTHNGTSLILLTGQNRTTANGDVGVFTCDSTNNWREANYRYAENDITEIADGNKTGAAPALADWTTGPYHTWTLTGNVTGTPTWTVPRKVGRVQAKVCQDGTGTRTSTWPASVKWAGAAAPTLTTTASRCDIITFYYDGTSMNGSAQLNFN